MSNASPQALDAERLMQVIQAQAEVSRLGPDLGAVMDVVAATAARRARAAGAVVELAEGADMVYRAAAGGATEMLGLRLRRDASLSGAAVREGRVLVCVDAGDDPRVDAAACRAVGVRSMVVAPLRHGSVVVGALKVYSPDKYWFRREDEIILELLAGLVGSAMFHASQGAAAELLHRATHDPLTGLANRALFYDRMRRLIADNAPPEECLGVVFLDMDGLKRINDDHGHAAGDAAIAEFARRLGASARRVDVCGRLGGDEFGVLLPHLADGGVAERIRDRLARAIEGSFEHQGTVLEFRASSGMALYPDDGREPDALVRVADARMYAAKRQRRQSATDASR